MSRRPIHPPVVYIEWQDASHLAGGWEDVDEVTSNARKFYETICAAGFLLQETDDFVVIAAGYNGHADHAANSFMIPRSEVSKMVHLRPAVGMEKK